MFRIFFQFCRVRLSHLDAGMRFLGGAALVSVIVAGLGEAFVIANMGSALSSAATPSVDLTAGGYWLILIFLLNAVVRVVQIYLSQLFVYRLGSHLTTADYMSFFGAEFGGMSKVHSAQFLKRFELINLIIHNVLSPLMLMISNTFILVGMLYALAVLNIEMVVYGGIGVLSFYLMVITLISPRLNQNSKMLSQRNQGKIYNLRESFSGMKELLISGYLREYVEEFKDNEEKLRQLQAMNLVFGATPRYILEVLAVCAAIGLVLLGGANPDGDGRSDLLVQLVPFAYAALKFLPLAQSIYSSWASFAAHATLVEEVISPLVGESFEYRDVSLNEVRSVVGKPRILSVNDLVVSYGGALILQSGRMSFKAGVPYRLTGPSGSGKTTFVESLMGLREQSFSGEVTIGNSTFRSGCSEWRSLFAFSSQQGLILNKTIRQNLTLFRSEPISDQEIVAMLCELNLMEVLNAERGLDCILSENGSNLSGGQRQRLSFARTVLSDRPILIFDEVVSNLDPKNAAIVELLISKIARDKICFYVTHKHDFEYPSSQLSFDIIKNAEQENPRMTS